MASIISVWPAEGRCCAADHYRTHYPTIGVETVPCQSWAAQGLSWIGASGERHDGPRCDRHILRDLGPMIPEPCGVCHGSGRIVRKAVVRGYGMVADVRRAATCLACDGTGRERSAAVHS